MIDAWARYRAGAPLSELERMAAGIAALHPEYHAILDDAERFAERDYPPEAGEANPFLHLALHLAIAEQLAIDQPPGLRAHYERLLAARGDDHEAVHVLLDCLAETVWQAQRTGSAFDATVYLGCLAARE